ncbi:hypothetical protein A6E01_19085 (plasmid) [Vibrio breoganii]|uniref:Flagellar protein FliL n=2 Tax=Vibrio TaxID=662 RepID=A0AAN0XZJ7_9VIBR|nr:hypothetical protein [Vibrio breoganii]ANO35319.1 hypothetical protein A6E01_19085 [Vibrio breoganii]PML12759.1 hypothetical protein BCT84_02420 [Vibrio breoganii]
MSKGVVVGVLSALLSVGMAYAGYQYANQTNQNENYEEPNATHVVKGVLVQIPAQYSRYQLLSLDLAVVVPESRIADLEMNEMYVRNAIIMHLTGKTEAFYKVDAFEPLLQSDLNALLSGMPSYQIQETLLLRVVRR